VERLLWRASSLDHASDRCTGRNVLVPRRLGRMRTETAPAANARAMPTVRRVPALPKGSGGPAVRLPPPATCHLM
jgi:hypothetical protein